jgi:hypothetical protein
MTKTRKIQVPAKPATRPAGQPPRERRTLRLNFDGAGGREGDRGR